MIQNENLETFRAGPCSIKVTNQINLGVMGFSEMNLLFAIKKWADT